MPCVEWFDRAGCVLPGGGAAADGPGPGQRRGRRRARLAGFVGDAGESVSLEHFGASADYQTLYEEFGFTAEHVAAAARASLARLA